MARVQPSRARRPYADERVLAQAYLIGAGSTFIAGCILGYLIGTAR